MDRPIIEYWTPPILWLVVIFVFSTDTFASSETSRIIVPFLTFFFPRLSPDQLDLWHGLIRKLGHIIEYFILASLAFRAVRREHRELSRASLLTFSFIALAAASDELHQGFTLSRTASPVDVGYDCFGALWALWLFTTYETRRLRTHSIL